MGDSGSLPLGAFMGYLAIVSKSELLLAVGFIFVLETVSVMLQVGSYKLRQKEFSLWFQSITILNKKVGKKIRLLFVFDNIIYGKSYCIIKFKVEINYEKY